MVRVTAYGGVNEIGGNKVLVEDRGTRVMLDFGMSFRAHGAYFAEFMEPRTNTEGLDLLKLGILPHLDGIYRDDVLTVPGSDELQEQHPEAADLWRAELASYGDHLERTGEPFLDAVLLTHAHLDHFGHIGFLDPRIPVDCTPMTTRLVHAIDEVTRSSGLSGEVVEGATREASEMGDRANFPGAATLDKGEPWSRPFRSREPYEPFDVGSFTVRLIPVDHSVPGAAAVHLEASDGTTILYTGDVRFHGRFDGTTSRLHQLASGMEPDLLVCEGTRITSTERDSEDDVRKGLVDRFQDTRGLGLVDFAWKDTTRFQTLQEVAEVTGRELVVNHKLAYAVKQLAPLQPDLHPVEDYPNVRVYVPRKDSMLVSPNDHNRDRLQLGYHAGDWDPEAPGALAHWTGGVRATDVRANPSRFIVMLSQWSMTELLDLDPPGGSVFVRAACEPFSEEMDLDLQRQARWLQRYDIPVAKRGGEEGDRDPIPQVQHASGHAAGPDLLGLVHELAPRSILPIHTEHPEVFVDEADAHVHPWDRQADGSVTLEI